MIISRIALKNIRSYTDAVVKIPTGITLLAGDIGAGKSTILLSIEFALFGTLRGLLPGDTLLRQGANEGKVTLTLEIGGKEIVITRGLKRTKNGISQETGSVRLEGVEQELSAMEIKSKVLGLLGYPSEDLTKNKGLVYRYTVYTPQEDMKKILFDDDGERLKVLRRVFDIDKYERIKNNTDIHIKKSNAECRLREGQIVDLESKRGQLTLKKEESGRMKDMIDVARKKVIETRKSVEAAEEEVKGLEAGFLELNSLRSKLLVLEQELRGLITFRSNLLLDRDATTRNLTTVNEQLIQMGIDSAASGSDPNHGENLRAQLGTLESNLRTVESSINQTNIELGKSRFEASHCTELSSKLNQMSQCPTCQQTVSEEHRHSISSKEREKLALVEQRIQTHSQALSQLQMSKASLGKKIVTLRDSLASSSAQAAAISHKAQLEQRINDIGVRLSQSETRINEITQQKNVINKAAHALEDVETKIKQAKTGLDIARAAERESGNAHTRLVASHDSLNMQIKELGAEIDAKQAIKDGLVSEKKRLFWVQEGFLPLVGLMEKHMFATVYHQFNDAFTSWFTTLLDDTLMNVRLGDSFEPIIVQNGYEIDAGSLSGGEKTSLALAYRLALNKVINDLHSTINTRDLIILDEPTDGFSSEQLDRVRDVMRELPVKQCILVSHENKMESFVDQVIRVEKQGHVSRVG